MNTFFSFLNQSFDLLFWPFRNSSPIWPVLIFALVTALFMLFVYRYFSNQGAIRKAKNLIAAHLLEVRLFQDQLGVVLRAYGRLLRATGVYLGHSLAPLAVLLLPLVLLLAQIELRLGREAASLRAPVLVKAHFASEEATTNAQLVTPEGVSVTAPPLRIAELREVNWRIEAARPEEFELTISASDAREAKQFSAGQGARLSPLRSSNWLDLLLYPGEPRLPDGAIGAIEVTYPTRAMRILGFEMHWLIPFFVFSLLFGYALKGVIGAEF